MGQVISHNTDVAAAGISPAAVGGVHSDHVLRISSLNKHFGGTQALKNARLSVRRGTVHALLGGNGSGKSTTIKILAGVYEADSGDLSVFGTDYSLSSYSSTTAQQAGLRFVHQDLGLFEELSIEENFALDAGYPRRAGGSIDWRALRSRVKTLLAEYEIDADPRQPINELRPADRTMVAIARALQDQENDELILVLDEPTASLAAQESNQLLENVRRRADKGQTIVIVSHRLQEVLSIAHDFTIFRDGEVVGELTDAHPTEDELVRTMAGGLVQALRPDDLEEHVAGETVLEITDLHSGPIHGVNLTVKAGEIVGIAGLVGSGRSSLLQAVFGARTPQSGTMSLNQARFAPSHIDEAMDRGVGMVPEDRGGEAAFPDRSVSENLAVSVLRESFTSSKWMSRRRENRVAADLISTFSIKVQSPASLFSSMSGGNQQKVIIARWLQRSPSLLLLDEPTQGVDVMSRADIYSVIRDAATDGCAVLVASSDMSELHALCTRVVFLHEGTITHEVVSGELDVDGLTRLVLSSNAAEAHRAEREARTTVPTQEKSHS